MRPTPSIRQLAWACALMAPGHAITPPSAAHAGRITYPQAPRGDAVDNYHGHAVADPYRWLEDTGTPRTQTWLGEEAKLTNRYLAAVPQRERIGRRLAELADYRDASVPWREAGSVFWIESSSEQPQGVLYALDRPGAKPRVFFDPNRISPDGSIAIGDYLVSPDGRYLAYRTAQGGADVGEIRVRDVLADRDTGDVVDGINGCWTRNSRGFFYARSFRGTESSAREGIRAFYHRLGDAQSNDHRLMEWNENARWAYFMTSEDGRYAALVAEEGPINEIFMMDLRGGENAPFKLLDGFDAIHTPVEWVGDTFFVRTELAAPRKRVISLDLRQGSSAKPIEVVPESSDVITDAVITGERLVINYLSDVHSRLALFHLDGTPDGEIGLPGLGAVGWPLGARPSTPELFYSYESFLSPPTVFSCDVRSPDDSTAFAYLRAYSPLQNVRAGACYPATMLLAADHDDRVVPSHAYKFAAALQAAQSCDAPILLRVAENASHSYSSRREMLAEHADMWAFIAANLGVSP